METLSELLALLGESLVTGGFTAQKLSNVDLLCFCDVRSNKFWVAVMSDAMALYSSCVINASRQIR